MVQWFCVTSWRLFDVWTSYFGMTFDLKINVVLCDLYFMAQWLCLISPRLFDAWVSYFQIMRQCDPNFDFKINMSTWSIFHGLVILLNIFKIIWWMNIIVGISVWHIDWPYQVYVSQWPIFYGPAILLHILKTIWWRNIVLGIMDQCDSKIDLVKYMWVSDLYFMVHWFYLISLSDLNYFYTLRSGTGRGYSCPSGHLL